MTPGEAASTVASLLAIDPSGLGGVCLRGPPGSRRDGWLETFRRFLPRSAPIRRVRSSVTDAQLFGGLDVAESLRRGHRVHRRGALADVHEGLLMISMAERLDAAVASRINAVIDTQQLNRANTTSFAGPIRFSVVAFDEGIDEEAPPESLLDRLAFHLRLEDIDQPMPFEIGGTRAIARARVRYSRVPVDTNSAQLICEAAFALGIESVRLQILANRAARAAAALRGAQVVSAADVGLAIELVLAPRAVRLPTEAGNESSSTPNREPDVQDPASAELKGSSPPDHDPHQDPLSDSTVAAVQSGIPKDLLERLRSQSSPSSNRGSFGRSGVKISSGRRGRPTGSTTRQSVNGARLNMAATLLAATPWQALRKRRKDSPIRFLASDFRFSRFKQHSRSLVVFSVDASGSSALYRLAEAKGAIELILGECYVRRDEVAVVAFRNRSAQLLLPPTRSLVRARQQLAGLPGGGATPVAAGLAMASKVALGARRRGDTPLLVLLTDGHANIDLAGAAGREAARRDALCVARQIADTGIAGLLIDTAPRPQPLAAELAGALQARYIPLPSSDSVSIAASVRNQMRRNRAGK